MSKHKSKKHSKLHQVISGVIAAAFAFTTIVTQVGSINGDHLKASLPEESAAFLDKHSAALQKLYVSGGTEAWYYNDAMEAAEAGLLNGDTDADGKKVMNPDALTKWAEGLTMLARVVAGGKDNIPYEMDRSIRMVEVMPDWAQPSVYFLIKNDRIDVDTLENLFKDNQPGDSLTRIEMMQLAFIILKLDKNSTLDVGAKFTDVAGLTEAQKIAARNLVELGIIGGETVVKTDAFGNSTTTMKLNPNGNLNRAAFVKILMSSRREAAQMETITNIITPTTAPGGQFEFPVDQVPVDNSVPTI